MQVTIMSCLAIVHFLLIILPLGYSVRNPYYNGESKLFDTLCPNWMSNLPDSIMLSEIVAPGTHGSMARYGGPPAQDQALKLDNQLMVGIRALDIRLRHVEDRFACHHELVFQKKMFGDVLNICNDFLDMHPSETIFMFIQEEYKPSKNNRSFEETFLYYRDATASGSKIWKGTTNTRLGDVRGKIVIVDNMPGEKTRGIPRYNFHEQNFWDIPTILKIDQKLQRIEAHFEIEKYSGFYSNWLSAAGWAAPPLVVARWTNHKAYEIIKRCYEEGKGNKCCRLVFSDFPGQDLIKYTILLNNGLNENVCQSNQ